MVTIDPLFDCCEECETYCANNIAIVTQDRNAAQDHLFCVTCT